MLPKETAPLAVLVVEDASDVRSLVVEWLRAWGHGALAAANSQEAITALQAQRFDLIITDVIMAEGNGYAVINWLKRHGHSVPVIAMSGGGGHVTAGVSLKSARRLGAPVTLEKPFTPDQLRSAMQAALGPAIP